MQRPRLDTTYTRGTNSAAVKLSTTTAESAHIVYLSMARKRTYVCFTSEKMRSGGSVGGARRGEARRGEAVVVHGHGSSGAWQLPSGSQGEKEGGRQRGRPGEG